MNLGNIQRALEKTAEQLEKQTLTLSELSNDLKTQHNDNIKTQRQMFWSNIVMTGATIVMAIATVIMAYDSWSE